MDERSRLHGARWELALLLVVTIVAVSAAEWLWSPAQIVDDRMAEAAQRMYDATLVIAKYRTAHGPPLDPDDVNRTGLIGTFFSPLTTTVGTLAAKRTATNPNVAAVAVRLLVEAGVRSGDAIAIGASGSFPSILLAVLCAASVLDLDVGLIVSLGASQWGANVVDFTWLDMQEILIEAGLLPSSYRADAVSFGGASDVGIDLDRSVRDALRSRISASQTPLLEEPDLQTNVAERSRLYHTAVAGQPIAAFVNIGGGWANVGRGEAPVMLAPGVNVIDTLPPPEDRGVLFEFAERGVPVVHFLYISALASAYGLPWDPSPLPEPEKPGTTGAPSRRAVAALAIAYIAFVVLWLVSIRHRRVRCRKS